MLLIEQNFTQLKAIFSPKAAIPGGHKKIPGAFNFKASGGHRFDDPDGIRPKALMTDSQTNSIENKGLPVWM